MSSVDNNKRVKITLTNSTGTELTPDTDMTSMYVQSTDEAGGATFDFYLSWNGQLNIELVNIRVAANAEIGLTYNLYYYALGAWKSIAPYASTLTGAQALAGISTSYPLVEDIISGTKVKFSVTSDGAGKVGVSANGRL